MTVELRNLVVIALVTALMWMPYVLESMRVRGMLATLRNPRPDAAPLAPWAERMKAAHANAVENLVLFAALVLALHAVGASTATTAAATTVYVGARIVHFLVYTAGIPVLRTVAFLVAFACQVALAGSLLA